MSEKIKIGIIGGSGLEDPKFLKDFKDIELETPYGKTSSKITTGSIKNIDVAIISRFGRDHSINPSKVPYRANIWALNELKCTHIIATSATGSLKEEIKPGDLVMVDQFIDFTRLRELTFFDDKVVHTPMAEPFCNKLRDLLNRSAQDLDLSLHEKGTIITIEGPRFSTKAESHMFKAWGADIINMSTIPEASLARELGICYQLIALITDYDCWKENEEEVTWEMILKQLELNASKAKELILSTIPKIDFKECKLCKKE